MKKYRWILVLVFALIILCVCVLCNNTEKKTGSNRPEQQELGEDSDPDDAIDGTQQEAQGDENQKTDTKSENENQKVDTNTDGTIQLPEDTLEDNGENEESEEPDSSQDEVENNDSSSKKPIVLPGIRID